MARIHSIPGQRVVPLDEGWELASTPAGASPTPADIEGRWLPARVPGTVALALEEAGEWTLEAPTPLHDRDHWFRTRFRAEGPQALRFQGLATLAEAWLDGEKVLSSDNMFLAHEVPATFAGEHELLLCFRALEPALQGRRGRARWRPRMIESPALRFFRTTLLGHLPGWSPPVHAVGPWRPIERVEEAPGLKVTRADLQARLDGSDGVLSVCLDVELAGAADRTATLHVAGAGAALEWTDANTLCGAARVPDVECWWPHTHGEPALHDVR
ncbi:MAG: glycoside hydrolase family 2 protein, partial [Gemmatimonadetes bacterium]|nr:glycoside hydrolase family 2 protein [Gemmatimonadota bacterium]